MISNKARSRFDVLAGEASPLDAAISSGDQQVLDLVAEALQAGRMRLAYQPAVYAVNPDIPGFYEGLIRILDATGRAIPAKDFMSVAETRELGREIDCAALRLGLQTLQANPGIRVAVNMSARSIGYRKWNATLRAGLREDPMIGKGLILEINEGSAMIVPDVVVPFMKDLRQAGIFFCLDDFGAEFTSLRLLGEFGFDMAKIDGQFIRGLDRSQSQQTIVRAAIAMASEFNMFPVAESVETVAEANFLRDEGVGALQGYLFGAPTVTPDFSAYQRARKS